MTEFARLESASANKRRATGLARKRSAQSGQAMQVEPLNAILYHQKLFPFNYELSSQVIAVVTTSTRLDVTNLRCAGHQILRQTLDDFHPLPSNRAR